MFRGDPPGTGPVEIRKRNFLHVNFSCIIFFLRGWKFMVRSVAIGCAIAIKVCAIRPKKSFRVMKYPHLGLTRRAGPV
jgi:hypothetical protein